MAIEDNHKDIKIIINEHIRKLMDDNTDSNSIGPMSVLESLSQDKEANVKISSDMDLYSLFSMVKDSIAELKKVNEFEFIQHNVIGKSFISTDGYGGMVEAYHIGQVDFGEKELFLGGQLIQFQYQVYKRSFVLYDAVTLKLDNLFYKASDGNYHLMDNMKEIPLRVWNELYAQAKTLLDDLPGKFDYIISEENI